MDWIMDFDLWGIQPTALFYAVLCATFAQWLPETCSMRTVKWCGGTLVVSHPWGSLAHLVQTPFIAWERFRDQTSRKLHYTSCGDQEVAVTKALRYFTGHRFLSCLSKTACLSSSLQRIPNSSLPSISRTPQTTGRFQVPGWQLCQAQLLVFWSQGSNC